MVLSSHSQGSGGQGKGLRRACEEPMGEFVEHSGQALSALAGLP